MGVLSRRVKEEQNACPYCEAEDDVCKASVTSLRIGALARLKRCNSENYDSCALFLAKCLRSGHYSYGY